MRDIQFVSYDGEYPNLCSGELVLNVAGKRVSADHCLTSGGSIGFDRNGYEFTDKGPWYINFDRFNISFSGDERRRITAMVNEKVPQGCCGGCI